MQISKLRNILRWVVVAFFVVRSFQSVRAIRFSLDGLGAAYMVGSLLGAFMCVTFAYMMYANPRRYGLGIGAIILVITVFEILPWRFGDPRIWQNNPSFVAASIRIKFSQVIALLIAATCIALHWIFPGKHNQLPDPTSPSVTPPAGAGVAPSVTADH